MTEGALPARGRRLGVLLLAGGLLTVAAMVGAEFTPVSFHGGFGLLQTMGALVGVAAAVQGASLVRPLGGDLVEEWRAALAAVRTENVARFGAIALQLALFALLVRQFQIESPAFARQIVPLVCFGFVVHHLLPARHRLAFFVALSLGGLLLVLGPANAAWVVAIVLAFVGLTRLPARFALRVALVLAGGALLAALRMQGGAPWSPGIWPVLGAILMFRLIVYLYDLRHATQPPTAAETLAYFFLLPNVAFPLFPVVDFATFCRTRYDRDPYAIYQQGLRWMLRGVTHLVVYRIVYQNFTLAASDVTTASDLVRYLLSTFLLYLRVSGQFHLIVGLLHLFGFRLPETHHFFYLAASFTDFWRRINIYWKDFMMKVVFYPAYFPLRRKVGDTAALVIGTAAVFGVTWLTHSYQWFWILGSWLLSWTDGLFWAILGVLLVGSSLLELKRGRSRAVAMAGWSPGYAVRLALRTAATFTVICVLWSLWGSPTLGEWLDLMSVRSPTAGDVAVVTGTLLLIGAAAVLADLRERRLGTAARSGAGAGSLARPALVTAAGFALLYAAGSPWLASRLGPRAEAWVRDLKVPELSKRDAAILQRGYYENLTGVGLQNSQLWELYAQRPAQGADVWQSGVLRDRDDFLAKDMRPLFGIYQRGQTFRTNRWGMRDRDYAPLPPPDGYRIALLGQSYVAGDGVSDGETFEEIAEDRLNARPGPHPRYEILNFAAGSYSVLQQLVMLPRVLEFRPQAVYLAGNPIDAPRAALHLVTQLRRGVPPPFEALQALLARAGVDQRTRETEALSRLKPYRDSILGWAYRQIVDDCRSRGVLPVWLYLNTPERGPAAAEVAAMAELARSAGFVTLDWMDVYDGHDLVSLQVSPWDFHPNAAGHRLIAERFYRELTTNPALAVPH